LPVAVTDQCVSEYLGDLVGGNPERLIIDLTGTSDPVGATVVLLASPGDRILTSDPKDLTPLAEAAANHAVIVAC
jgi:hypothetical protein